MKSYIKLAFVALLSLHTVQSSHLDDPEDIETFKWDTVKFKTKKDCSLDHHPDVSFFEVYDLNFFIFYFIDANIFRNRISTLQRLTSFDSKRRIK